MLHQSRRSFVSISALVALGAVALLMGCRSAAAGAAPPLRTITIVGNDYGFSAPERIAAGRVRLSLQNHGREVHHIQVLRLPAGKTMEDLLGAISGESLPEWAEQLGGPNGAIPGDSSEAVLTLQPGQYALLCIIPSPDHVPHVAKGMIRMLEVIASDQPDAPAPAVDVELALVDYGFDFSAPLTAGRRTIRVVNRAEQAHEVLLLALDPGKTPLDFITWFDAGAEGRPPARPIGGTTGLARQKDNILTLDLPAGEYGLICFWPDVADGRPHFLHGMMSQVTVR